MHGNIIIGAQDLVEGETLNAGFLIKLDGTNDFYDGIDVAWTYNGED